MPDPLIIAHLTDPHLPLAHPEGRELLSKRGLSYANWLRRRRHLHRAEVTARIVDDLLAAAPDFIAMTGDLVNFSLEREFAAGAEWLAALGPPEAVGVIPGNHEAMDAGFGRRMRRHWGPYLAGDDGRPGFPWLRQRGDVALIGLSSAVATPPFLATGRLGDDQCAALATILDQTGRHGLCRVVLVHHPPTRITRWRKRLTDAKRLVEVIRRSGAELVLHGHTHRADLSWIDTPAARVPVIGAPASGMLPGSGHDPGAWRSLAIARGEAGWTLTLTERRATRSGNIEQGAPLTFALPDKSLGALAGLVVTP